MKIAKSDGSELTHQGLITRRQLQQLLPVSTTTIWRREKSGLFPKHVTVGGLNFWRAIEVHEYLTLTSLDLAPNTEWESLLFAQYQSALAVVLETGELRDAIKAAAAWQRWLLSYLPDERERDAIPTPRLLRDIINRGEQS